MIYHAILEEYFNLILLSSLRSSLQLNGEIVCFIWYLPNISLCCCLSIFFLLLLFNLMACGFLTFNFPFLSMSSFCQPTASLHKLHLLTPGPSLLLLLVFHWSRELALAPGDNHPIVEEDDRPKNFSSSILCFMSAVPVLFLQPLTFPSIGSHLFSSRRLEIIFSPSFPPSFPICWFLLHILILPCNTDIYSLTLKACTKYIPVFPYI